MSPALQDAAARRIGRSEFGHAVVLEAGAGSGKTAVLVARVVHWVLGPGWDKYQGLESAEAIAEAVAQGVVAITFTDAAAVEMQMRVAAALRGICQGDAPAWLEQGEILCPAEQLHARAAALLAASDRLRIQTIHGFCSTLLRDYALRARLHPNFQIDADGSLLEQLALETVQLRLHKLYGEQADPDALLLAANGFGPTALVQHLRFLASRAIPADDLLVDPVGEAAFTAWKLRALTPIADAEQALGEAFQVDLAEGGKVPTKLAKLHQAWLALNALAQGLREAESASELPQLFGEDGPAAQLDSRKLSRWAKHDWTQAEEKVLGQGQREVVAELCLDLPLRLRLMRKFDPELLRAGSRLLAKLLADLSARMHKEGVQVYDALLMDTRRVLAEDAQVANWLRASIDQLLVDEFQDTDAGQCELIARIALDDSLDSPRPGLFLVGDPKQSIYGWRSADLRAYSDFVKGVLADGGELQSLQVNFRSVQGILDEVERVIKPSMHEVEGRQPAFVPLLVRPDASAELGFQDAGRRAVEHWVSWSHDSADWRARGSSGADTNSAAARQLEARAIAEELASLHQAGSVAWGDVALLMRATSHLDTYLAAFREAGIPFQVERDRSYFRRREILDAACLVRCILDPHDQVALIAFLRSPMVGVPDAAWLPLWGALAPERPDGSYRPRFPELVSELQASIENRAFSDLAAMIEQAEAEVAALHAPGVDLLGDWSKSLLFALQQLAALRQSFAVDPADEFVAKLRAAFLQEGTEAARFLGAHRLANLERFYATLTAAMQEDDGGPQAVLRQLRVATSESRDESEAAPGDESLDAVRVMTVHKSKGLTFSHVYLVDTHGGARASTPLPTIDFAKWQGQTELCLFGVPSLGWEFIEAERAQVSAAETLRLFYVAMTRPQHRLVICGRRNPDMEAAAGAKTLEGLMRHRHGDLDLVQWFQESHGEDTSIVDEYGALWRLPWPKDFSPRASNHAQSGGDFGIDRAVQEIQQLAAHREAAAQRSRFARVTTASRMVSHEAYRMEVLGQGDEAETGAVFRVRGDREIAQAVGTAVHRVLECLDLNGDPNEALAKQEQLLPDLLGGLFDTEALPQILSETRRVLHKAEGQGLIADLFKRAPQILGREIPVLLPGDSEAEAAVLGTLDLLYRDLGTGQLIVADFKTDTVTDDAHMIRLRDEYRAQGQVYCRAVESIFPDEELAVGFELWFLTKGEICPVPLKA